MSAAVALEKVVDERSHELFAQAEDQTYRRTDRMFAGLMIFQWVFGIGCALILTPKTWRGEVSAIHPHVWAAIFLGAIITVFPVALVLLRPGQTITRHTVAFAQALWSALLIHLTGGRIETHFHVFGSLAFLAFYRDWRVLITASIVVAADHYIRGAWYPESVYGVISASPWRWVEHAAWVLFIDGFLIAACFQSRKEMWEISFRRARLEKVNEDIENRIQIRTKELVEEKALTDAQSKLLSRSNEELKQFAYVASHDLQEPLRMISSYLQLLEKKYKGKLDKDADDYINFAVDGSVRLKRLIDDLLDYSRVGTEAKKLEQIDSETVFKRSLKNLEVAIKESGVKITHDQLPTILAEEVQLERLFQNLIANAIKYRKIGVSSKVHVSAKQDDDTWVFSIKDNGIGIDKNHYDRIFSIFQRLHTSAEYSGTGIGLSVCRRIVENHGGRIWVESQPGEGSAFYFSVSNQQRQKEVS